MKRITLLGALLAVIMAAVVALAFGSGANAQEGNPIDAVENTITAFDAGLPTGDGASIAATFTENGVFASFENNESFAVVGRPALEAAFSEPDPAFSVTVVELEADGDSVTGSAEVTDSIIQEGGFERVIDMVTAVVEDGLVASFTVEYDLTDEETAEYVEYVASQPDDDDDGGGPSPDALILDLEGDQPGQAVLEDFDGITFVGIDVEPGAEGVRQPAHIHTGTCDEPGGIVFPLASPVDGSSFTLLSTTRADLLANNYIVNVHLSPEEPGTYVACGVLESDDAAGPGLPSTGTGGPQTSDDSNGLMWLVAALGIGGAVIAGAGVVVARRR